MAHRRKNHLEDTRALALGDYNADGLLDLYVGYTSGAREDFAKIPCRIYRNDGKKFIEVTKSNTAWCRRQFGQDPGF